MVTDIDIDRYKSAQIKFVIVMTAKRELENATHLFKGKI